MGYSIKISKSVQKQIDDLPNAMKGRILEKIKGLEIEPCPSGIVKLKNSEQEHRLRIGDYRVLYEIDDAKQTILILQCKHRREVYRQ
ncbi:MAG: type II toxin-antitoxin system RelE/ParE family toxin [Microcystis aeruginosa L211-101]|jgi:mRNA interferase RelE/StbE|nr:type II toxin-antitoxin system RelE/ParE family toxin [Microcystis aeruginosa L211-11]NCR31256.1 type II toxin-antitoxin system RelE/ParE family toxin [Microcystis aeruginosa L211-101]